MWMSPADADDDRRARQRLGRGGQPQRCDGARARSSPTGCPTGTVFVYHAQERTIDVPKTETTGRRGGIHNSLTRLLVKPSHLIGGYAQLSFAFNYLGPTGNQRDEVTVVRRRRSAEGGVLNARHGAAGDGDEPRQVHRLPHLLGDLQAGVDQPGRHRVRVVQQRRNPPRTGLSAQLRGPGPVAGRLGAQQARPAAAAGRWPGAASCCAIFSNPMLPSIDDYYEPWTYDYEKLTAAPLGDHLPVAPPQA